MPASTPRKTFVPKTPAVTYENVDIPRNSIDFFKSFKSASSTSVKTSNHHQINVLPNLIPIQLAILSFAFQFRSQLTNLSDPKVSPYTFAFYCTQLILAFFFIHDAEINPVSSRYTDPLLSSSTFTKFIDYFYDLPVPDFLLAFFHRLQTTPLDARPNLVFAPSFTGYTHYTHFGTIFPSSMFSALHDLVSVSDARTSPNRAHFDFHTSHLFSITQFRNNPFSSTETPAPIAYYVFNFLNSFNTNSSNTTIEYYQNKIKQIFDNVFSINAFRKYVAEVDYSPIGLQSPSVPTANYNPYTVYGSWIPSNLSEIKHVLQTVASALHEKKLATSNFASSFPQSGSTILSHGHSLFGLPTWNALCRANTAIPDFDDIEDVRPSPVYDDSVRASLLFKQALTYSSTAHPLTPGTNGFGYLNFRVAATPTPLPPAVTALVAQIRFEPNTRVHPPVFSDRYTTTVNLLADPIPPVALFPDESPQPTLGDVTPDQMVISRPAEYQSDTDVYPLVKIFCFDNDITSCHLATLCGMVIKFEELSGSIAVLPTTTTGTDTDNNQFLQSAIPMSLTHLATDFRSRNPVPSRITARIQQTHAVQPSTWHFRHPTTVYHSQLARTTFTPSGTFFGNGLTHARNQALPHLNQTFFGHHVETVSRPPTNGPQRSEPHGTPYGHLLAWSPYTFRDPRLSDLIGTEFTVDTLRWTYFLMDIRPLIGLAFTTAEVEDAIASIPTTISS